MEKSPNAKHSLLIDRAREMRHDASKAEQRLWFHLRNHELGGFKFRRQDPIAGYIADFRCFEAALVIEVDGDTHEHRQCYDKTRTRIIERGGDRVIRFLNEDVLDHTEAVVEWILEECERRRQRRPSPYPLPEGEGKEGAQRGDRAVRPS
jgi:very-short-patch-repair endonuclease